MWPRMESGATAKPLQEFFLAFLDLALRETTNAPLKSSMCFLCLTIMADTHKRTRMHFS